MTGRGLVRRFFFAPDKAEASALRRRVTTAWWAIMALVGMCAVLQAHASAEANGSAVDAADERATAFRAVQGPSQESVPGGALFVAGYAMVWLLVFGYVIRLHRMSMRTSHEIQELRALAQQISTHGVRQSAAETSVERG